jgi:hypothetical protein
MSLANTMLVGMALIVGSSLTVGVIGAMLDIPRPITAILGGCVAILSVHYGLKP